MIDKIKVFRDKMGISNWAKAAMILALNASGNSRIGLLLFITFTIGKSFLLTIAAFFTAVVFIVFCMEATFVEANLMFILVVITIMVALIAFLFEKTRRAFYQYGV
ncbi:hypothetical protein [Lysinibacillus sp. C5.1]|uniref:hypothetical protein n=1 Tax=Lysinibacillus sp. C5.1 TaxID=2796169 RepID=UPI0030821B41